MRFENSFVVDAAAEDVWSTLMDVERVAPCMPGAEVLERIGDDSYKVGIKVKLGPISMLYRGQVEIVERDDAAHRATMRARAKEARGQGTANADIHMHLVEEPDGTRALMETDVQLAGRAAAMGQGVIADVSASLIEQFASNLTALLQPAPANGGASGAGTTLAAEARATTASAQAQKRAAGDDALPMGKIVAGAIASRLSRPRTLLAASAVFGVTFLAIGYAIGKAK
jgi:uncharacterized protein